jgi:hypothetical protein
MSNVVFDGVIKSEFISHIDEVTHVQTQPDEDLILARNAELRKNPDAIMDLGARSDEGTWGRMVASIPFNMLEKARRDGYDLYNRDADFASKELHRYLQSEEGKLCLIRDKTTKYFGVKN